VTKKVVGKTIVVALGGNAILQATQRGTTEEQLSNLQRACEHLVPLVQEGYKLVITHGNGPQVGNLLIQQAEAVDFAPYLSMDICVAMTQAQIGTMIQEVLTSQLRAAGLQKNVVILLSHFLVDREDPDFQALSKPIGPFLSEGLKARYEQRYGHIIRKVSDDPQRPYRRVVPSPMPLRLQEKAALKALVDTGAIVIAGGGGGIPVVLDQDGQYRPIEAVIDKDLAGEKLAETLAADIYMILTDVDKVYLNFGKPGQQPLDRLSFDEAQLYYSQGHFARGSMAPKMLACLQFIEFGGDAAIITSLESAYDAIKGKTGTRIVRR
jgi:carbamate kinase